MLRLCFRLQPRSDTHVQIPWGDGALKRTLSDLALKDIEAKLSEENISDETFSSFAARYVLKRCIAILVVSLDQLAGIQKS